MDIQFLKAVAVGLVGEVFTVYPRDRIQKRLVQQNTLTFQFRVVEVFTVYAQERFLLLHPRTSGSVDVALQSILALFSNI